MTNYFSSSTMGLIPSDNPVDSENKLNGFFQHLSVGYNANPGEPPSWAITRQWNWASFAPQIVSPVKEQGSCSALTSVIFFFTNRPLTFHFLCWIVIRVLCCFFCSWSNRVRIGYYRYGIFISATLERTTTSGLRLSELWWGLDWGCLRLCCQNVSHHRHTLPL